MNLENGLSGTGERGRAARSLRTGRDLFRSEQSPGRAEVLRDQADAALARAALRTTGVKPPSGFEGPATQDTTSEDANHLSPGTTLETDTTTMTFAQGATMGEVAPVGAEPKKPRASAPKPPVNTGVRVYPGGHYEHIGDTNYFS